MAKVIATVGGVALKPGVSLNRRWYTRPMIAATVQQAQKAIESGAAVVRDLDDPLSALTHHGAEDDSTRIVGRLTSLALDEDGGARYEMALADTPHARTIAALADTSDGKPAFLRGVSIRGAWTGTVRKVKGPDGKPVETADGLELLGLDFTRSPGVPGAGVDTFAWADRSGRSETTERVLIFESVPEAHVSTMTEQAPAAEGAPAPGVAEAVREALGLGAHVFEDGLCVTCVAEGGDAPGDGSKPYGNVTYADPGYQKDKKKRYPVDTKAHARAALGYLSKKANAAKYTAAQLKRVMGRIRAACKKFGVSVAAESAGWTFGAPARVTEAMAEYYGDPCCAGSWSVNASNGPVSICMSSYSMDPEDLDVILRAAADAACMALRSLDPDMDGDVDLPGAPSSDTDHDGGESAPPDDPETDPAASPAAATTETEEPAMSEPTTTPAAETAPAPDQSAIAEAVKAALAAQDEARRARKAAKREAQEAATAAAAKAAAESAALGAGTPATAGAAASETAEQRMARLEKLAEARLAEAAKAAGLATEKTDEQLLEEIIERKLTPLRQAAAEGGQGTARKGLLTDIAESAPGSAKLLENASAEELSRLAAASYPPPLAARR